MIQTILKTLDFSGKPRIPGDKSISHRGLILGALAEGRTQIFNLLDSQDVHSTMNCLRDLGVTLRQIENCTYVEGVGISGLKNPQKILDCRNSGTTMRLMMGVLAGTHLNVTLTGDSSLLRRPMRRVTEPLTQMGAEFTLTQGNFAPLSIRGRPGAALHGIHYELKIASAQIKTAILLAALSAKGVSTMTGEIFSRDHTERLLKHFGVALNLPRTANDLHSRENHENSAIRILGGQKLRAATVHVPGDFSAAAFWIAAACIIPNSQIEIESVSLIPTRIGFLRVLQKMGAQIQIHIEVQDPEPLGRLQVTSSQLRAVTITKEEIPSIIDELPLLAIVASQASGLTRVEGAQELRVKESDRIEALAQGLRAMGGKIQTCKDGFWIEGPQSLVGGTIESFHDHRIAMAFSIAALLAEGKTQILDAECVSISYPQFYKILQELTRP